MPRSPLLVLGRKFGNKKTPLGDCVFGREVPDSKNLATSMSFVNAYRAFILLRSPLTGAV
jgi:hypothetical protein